MVLLFAGCLVELFAQAHRFLDQDVDDLRLGDGFDDFALDEGLPQPG
ncbi:hypothetical protein ACFW2K_37960 [Streptomyces nigra]